jgi:mono/diheme cytochrome c family protein
MRRLAAALFVFTISCGSTKPVARPARTVQLNQGWSAREVQFFNHSTEGTNLAPLDFVLHLPGFVAKMSKDYGFIPSEKADLNPHGLPVGFAIDERPKKLGDRAYLGITCSGCHTRQLTYSKDGQTWLLPVHGGPSLVDYPRFKKDLYDAFFALLKDDNAAREFAKGVLGKEPDAAGIAALRDEIREFTGPVTMTEAIFANAKIPAADFGPGNLNALSQGNYNNYGLAGWLKQKGYQTGGGGDPIFPRMEGAVNYPPMWFAPSDTWAQWFVEIYNAAPRNWVQSISTSEVRPPKMIEALKGRALVASVHYENLDQIQRSLELLRPPKWPEEVLGAINPDDAKAGRLLYEQQCAECHTRKVAAPNRLGIVLKERPAFDVGTDPVAYEQFAGKAAERAAALTGLSNMLLGIRKAQFEKSYGEHAQDYMNLESRGVDVLFRLAKDYSSSKDAPWPRSGAAYWAPPMDGIFATSPYFHNGSVRTLKDVLTVPAEREKTFKTGSAEFDAERIGLKNEGPFLYDTKQPGKGNGGHPFGTDLSPAEKTALIEYLKSL